jgi:hypothetical protein
MKMDKDFVDIILLYLDSCLLTVSKLVTRRSINQLYVSSSQLTSYLCSYRVLVLKRYSTFWTLVSSVVLVLSLMAAVVIIMLPMPPFVVSGCRLVGPAADCLFRWSLPIAWPTEGQPY